MTRSGPGRHVLYCFDTKCDLKWVLVRAIKLLGGFLVSSSADGWLGLTSLQTPSQPRNTLEMADCDGGAVLELCVSQDTIITLSQDSRLRLWKTESESSISSLSVGNRKMTKMAVSWPICILAGLNIVELWNLEKQQCLQTVNGTAL